MYPKHVNISSLNSQRGFLIPLAAIIIVGVGIMALTVSRISSQSNSSSVIEGLSLQAFYAAESGAQFGLNNILFNQTLQANVDANCAALAAAPVYINFTESGLASCGALVSCSCEGACSSSGTVSYYRILSEARCGDFTADGNGNVLTEGSLVSERSVAVTAFM